MKKFKEDTKVWFVDLDSRGVAFPEDGYVRARRKTDNRYVVQFYAGIIYQDENHLYHTREECENAIKNAYIEVKNEV